MWARRLSLVFCPVLCLSALIQLVLHSQAPSEIHDRVTRRLKITQPGKVRTKLFLITLDTPSETNQSHYRNNIGRRQKFLRHWEKVCGQVPEIQVCPGRFHPEMGHGVTEALIACFKRVLADPFIEVAFFFEDDARLFDSASEFCTVDGLRRLADHAPSNLHVGLLGCHTAHLPGPGQLLNLSRFGKWGYLPLARSYGGYSMMIRRSQIPLVQSQFELDIKVQGKISPDITIYDSAKKHDRQVFAISPLPFWHQGGYSNTHKRMRADIDQQFIVNQSFFVNAIDVSNRT